MQMKTSGRAVRVSHQTRETKRCTGARKYVSHTMTSSCGNDSISLSAVSNPLLRAGSPYSANTPKLTYPPSRQRENMESATAIPLYLFAYASCGGGVMLAMRCPYPDIAEHASRKSRMPLAEEEPKVMRCPRL